MIKIVGIVEKQLKIKKAKQQRFIKRLEIYQDYTQASKSYIYFKNDLFQKNKLQSW